MKTHTEILKQHGFTPEAIDLILTVKNNVLETDWKPLKKELCK